MGVCAKLAFLLFVETKTKLVCVSACAHNNSGKLVITCYDGDEVSQSVASVKFSVCNEELSVQGSETRELHCIEESSDNVSLCSSALLSSSAGTKISESTPVNLNEYPSAPSGGIRIKNSFAHCCLIEQKDMIQETLSSESQTMCLCDYLKTLEPLDKNDYELLWPSNVTERCIYEIEMPLDDEVVNAELLCFDNKNCSFNNQILVSLYTAQELHELKTMEDIRQKVSNRK
ncbi:hypothetical protein RFI_01473 [Reticulomyxa filosa]|uniref:Uncharacterized protein n=1 Tax=Reticulomyxa filosa TaxID=46433 RepID=X6PC01_RETFI|nr:hypothetical protein RFI_01473 [Reticulomyxa filosa]|eukprot:ETO35589.1 hypothetical protein RFI_01473 [Reticulomyxa filosa]